MNINRSLRSRIVGRLSVLSIAVVAVLVPAQAAFARVIPDNPNDPYLNPTTLAAPPPTVVSHGSSGSGLAVWIVVLIAIAAIAAGFALSELVRSVSRRVRGGAVAAQSW